MLRSLDARVQTEIRCGVQIYEDSKAKDEHIAALEDRLDLLKHRTDVESMALDMEGVAQNDSMAHVVNLAPRLMKWAAMLRSLDDEAKVLRGTRKYMLDNEAIYKAQIKNLHILLGQMVNRIPGTAAYNETRTKAAQVVLEHHMSGSTNGIANND